MTWQTGSLISLGGDEFLPDTLVELESQFSNFLDFDWAQQLDEQFSDLSKLPSAKISAIRDELLSRHNKVWRSSLPRNREEYFAKNSLEEMVDWLVTWAQLTAFSPLAPMCLLYRLIHHNLNFQNFEDYQEWSSKLPFCRGKLAERLLAALVIFPQLKQAPKSLSSEEFLLGINHADNLDWDDFIRDRQILERIMEIVFDLELPSETLLASISNAIKPAEKYTWDAFYEPPYSLSDVTKLINSQSGFSSITNIERDMGEALGSGSVFVGCEEADLSLRLEYFDGKLFDKSSDTEILTPVLVSGEPRTPEQIVYFAITGKWFSAVTKIDGSKGLSYHNLIHSDFELENVRSLDIRQLELNLEFDDDEAEIYWKFNSSRSGLSNSVLQDQGIAFQYAGSTIVNWFGKIFMFPPFADLFLSGYDTGGITIQMPDFDEVDLDHESDEFGRNKKIRCFYCGDDSSITSDHVVPVSSASATRTYNERDVVPCCMECNTLLSNKWITTVEERASYLAERIAVRYKSSLDSADFSEEELLQLGPRLRSTVTANIFQKRYVVARIDHCHKIAGSLYDPEKVSHLRGMTTFAKKLAYNILTDYVFGKESLDDYIKISANRLDVSEDEIKKILSERMHVDMAIQLKFDNGFNLSGSIHQIAKVIRGSRSE